jgi:hypothetical protein
MPNQKIFRLKFLANLIGNLKKNKIDEGYLRNGIKFDDDDVLEVPGFTAPKELKLTLPAGSKKYDFENAVKVFEAYKDLSWTQATDARFWTYLTHVTCWDFVKKRSQIEKSEEGKRGDFILRHYFVVPVNTSQLLLNDISLLWWTAHLTYDSAKRDPYQLTKEAFSMLDYTRHLLPGIQGRNKKFAHAVLEYVSENKELFSKAKEAKVRFIMRKCNYVAGYRVLPSLTKVEIKKLIAKYKREINSIVPKAEIMQNA